MSKIRGYFYVHQKAPDGKNNICGKNIASYRREMHISQRQLAELLQLHGLDIDKNAVQRIESGQRFITDIELKVFSTVMDKPYETLYRQMVLTNDRENK